jgi:hypothetical protein
MMTVSRFAVLSTDAIDYGSTNSTNGTRTLHHVESRDARHLRSPQSRHCISSKSEAEAEAEAEAERESMCVCMARNPVSNRVGDTK